MIAPRMLLSTVGTSLFSNLKAIKPGEYAELAAAFAGEDWPGVARGLAALPATDRINGAEINSIARLRAQQSVAADCGLHFFHSDTDDGRAIAAILVDYFIQAGHDPVEAVPIEGQQDSDPRRFRTVGLRNLARSFCHVLRDYSPGACAINATGGYKAQIAVAVLLGQAIGVPVYYLHERFSDIIAFPPLPVALDFEVWMRASGLLHDLDQSVEPAPAAVYADEWDERYESLVERITIDGADYLQLSATGQIFHETFRSRFAAGRKSLLPPAASAERKQAPQIPEREGHMNAYRDRIERFMTRATQEVPQVVRCATKYYNPDLPQRTRFRLSADGIEGILSDGRWCVKFHVDTTAETAAQQQAVVAALNEWVASR